MIPILVTLGLVIAVPGITMDHYFFRKMRQYVRGSYQRYVAATMYIIGNGVEAIGLMILTVAYIMLSSFIVAALNIFLIVTCIICIVITLRREDNWFNDRWNKLKQAIKKAYKAATSVRINVPRPATA